jgi:hypothetical protein
MGLFNRKKAKLSRKDMMDQIHMSPVGKIVEGKEKTYKFGKAKGNTKKTYTTDVDENAPKGSDPVKAQIITKYRRDGSIKNEKTYEREEGDLASVRAYEESKNNVASGSEDPEKKPKKVGHLLSKEGKVNDSTRGMAGSMIKMLGETKGSTLYKKKQLDPMSDGKPGYHRQDFVNLKKEGMITDTSPVQGDASEDGPSYDTENPMMKRKKNKDPRYKDMSQKEIDEKVKTHYTGTGDEKESKNDAIKRFKEENPDNKRKIHLGRKIKAKF